jgi:hypothetical protein
MCLEAVVAKLKYYPHMSVNTKGNYGKSDQGAENLATHRDSIPGPFSP